MVKDAIFASYQAACLPYFTCSYSAIEKHAKFASVRKRISGGDVHFSYYLPLLGKEGE